MNIAPFRKLVAAAVGLAVMLGARHGFDLTGHEALLTDAAVAILTAAAVYFAPNERA